MLLEEAKRVLFRPFYYECVGFLSIKNEFFFYNVYIIWYLNILIVFFSDDEILMYMFNFFTIIIIKDIF